MKRLFLFSVALLLCSGAASAAVCAPPSICGEGQFSRWNGSAWVCGNLANVSLSYRDCERVGLPKGSTVMTCPGEKVITKLYYEEDTWSNMTDNHSFPEIWNVMCCSLRVD